MIQAAKIIGTRLATTSLIGAGVGIGVVFGAFFTLIALLTYVLAYGNMYLWGATVITNLMTAIHWILMYFLKQVVRCFFIIGVLYFFDRSISWKKKLIVLVISVYTVYLLCLFAMLCLVHVFGPEVLPNPELMYCVQPTGQASYSGSASNNTGVVLPKLSFSLWWHTVVDPGLTLPRLADDFSTQSNTLSSGWGDVRTLGHERFYNWEPENKLCKPVGPFNNIPKSWKPF